MKFFYMILISIIISIKVLSPTTVNTTDNIDESVLNTTAENDEFTTVNDILVTSEIINETKKNLDEITTRSVEETEATKNINELESKSETEEDILVQNENETIIQTKNVTDNASTTDDASTTNDAEPVSTTTILQKIKNFEKNISFITASVNNFFISTKTSMKIFEELKGCKLSANYKCQNNGTCTENGKCVCIGGYSGDKCEIFIGCMALGSLECVNGSCELDGKCLCYSGYTGKRCENVIEFTACQDEGKNSCLNGGKCAHNGNCICKLGYYGRFCSIYIGCNAGECLSCANEGICLPNGTCLCKFGFSSDQCETYIGCNAGGKLACENGGICQNNGHCECIDGFTGLTCSSGCDSGPEYTCLHGGVCGLNKKCICKNGYNGSTCAIFVGCNDNKGCFKCLNGGICQSNGHCICKPGFSGKRCAEYTGLKFILETVILSRVEMISLFSMTGLKKTSLLYRASRDGFTAAAFHAKCDYKAKTITLIKTSNNYVIGGYTSQAWTSLGVFKTDDTAYIFSLRRNGVSTLFSYGLRPTPSNVTPTYSSRALYTLYGLLGPSFGNGDILVENRSDVNASSSVFNTYNTGPDSVFGTPMPKWYTSDIEVFQIV